MCKQLFLQNPNVFLWHRHLPWPFLQRVFIFLPTEEQPQEVELLVQKSALGTMYIKRAGLHTHTLTPIRHIITFQCRTHFTGMATITPLAFTRWCHTRQRSLATANRHTLPGLVCICVWHRTLTVCMYTAPRHWLEMINRERERESGGGIKSLNSKKFPWHVTVTEQN